MRIRFCIYKLLTRILIPIWRVTGWNWLIDQSLHIIYVFSKFNVYRTQLYVNNFQIIPLEFRLVAELRIRHFGVFVYIFRVFSSFLNSTQKICEVVIFMIFSPVFTLQPIKEYFVFLWKLGLHVETMPKGGITPECFTGISSNFHRLFVELGLGSIQMKMAKI